MTMPPRDTRPRENMAHAMMPRYAARAHVERYDLCRDHDIATPKYFTRVRKIILLSPRTPCFRYAPCCPDTHA